MDEALADTAESENLSMRQDSNRENRETQVISLPHGPQGTVREGASRTSDMHVTWESDGFIVPAKPTNKTESIGGGVGGGKETDQGERQADLTRSGLRAGPAWHRIAERTTSRLAANRDTRGRSRMR